MQGSLPLRRKWLTLLEATPRRARTYKTAAESAFFLGWVAVAMVVSGMSRGPAR